MSFVELTASKHVHPFVAFLADHGEPVQPLVQRAGLPGACVDDGSILVPTAALWRFRELAARRTGLPNLTLTVMAPLELSGLGAVGASVARAPTLGRAIRDFQRLAGKESSTAILELRPCRGGDVFFSNRFNLREQDGEWHAELYVLTWMLKIVRIFEPTWSPNEIWCMACATPERLRAIESLATRARFGRRCSGFPLPASMLALSRGGAGASGRRGTINDEALWPAPPSDSVAVATGQLIRAYADDRWLSLQEASDLLGSSPRTFQRQLSGEEKTYSAVLEEARAEVARYFLWNTDASLSEIAERLGYSTLSNFNRAFHRWAAVSPREFRAQGHAPGLLV